jgi:hypothetical protein
VSLATAIYSPCPHTYLNIHSYARLDLFTVDCQVCEAGWSYDDHELPHEIERRALPVWLDNGL